MRLSLIVAIAKNDVIGNNNQLPWHLPADLKKFRQLTTGHPILMGRKTFDSIGKPLPGRTSIVISRQSNLKLPDGVLHASSVEDAVKLAASCQGSEEVFVIGGAEIYRQALHLSSRCYLTRILSEPIGDTRLPNFPGAEFALVDRTPLTNLSPESVGASFEVYERI